MRDVCKIIGIKMSQAQYWTRKGVVKADITGHMTQGKTRLFSSTNLFEFFLVWELTRRGVKVIEAKSVVEKIRENFPSLVDHEPKYGLITWRTMADPLLVYFGKGFFVGSLHEIATKGIRNIWLWEEGPPGFLKDFQVRGFQEKLSVVLQYYISALVVNLEALRLDLVKRLKEVG